MKIFPKRCRHNWVLLDSESRFEHPGFVLMTDRKWYCSKCRAFETTTSPKPHNIPKRRMAA